MSGEEDMVQATTEHAGTASRSSGQGGKRERLVTSKDILGQMARFAVTQHPYHEPVGLFEVCRRIEAAAEAEFKDSAGGLAMHWFGDSQEIYEWVKAIVWNMPEFLAWNVARSQHGQNISVSRYDGGSRPEDDFIDLYALVGNVASAAWADAAEFERE
jgi:hypothetical protein